MRGTAKFNEVIETLFTGLKTTKENIGGLPRRRLMPGRQRPSRDNPKRSSCLSAGRPEVNEKGEYLDPWGTP